ncbi:MAG: SMI1/KNR4 family protein [Ruminococcus sp.]|nr:SMI1/KNR4 family protein [Ruminococcus sp.]
MIDDIIKVLPKLNAFRARNSVDFKTIKNAESRLNLAFADEFSRYIESFGVASCYGHEFTGICKSSRLNVVDVTISERANNPDVPNDWYVIEQANIDGIVIWQNQKGEIFQTQPYCDSIKIANSIVEYITLI